MFFAMAFTLAAVVGFSIAEASELTPGSDQAKSCAEEPQDLAREALTALMQVQTHVSRGSNQKGQTPTADLLPVGRTFLSTDPEASAQFLVEHYQATKVELPACEGVHRAAVRVPFKSNRGPPALVAFIKDWTLPAGGVDIEATIRGMRSTLERASRGAEAYWFPLDNHDGWNSPVSTFAEGVVAGLIADGVPLAGYFHESELLGASDDGLAVDVQIPHTLQVSQTFLHESVEGLSNVTQHDCRMSSNSSFESDSWWKSTFSAANPAAAADFAVNVLGAKRIPCEYALDAPGNCTSAAWVVLPGQGFQLHFVRSSGYQHYPGEIDAFTQQVRSLRNMAAGEFDLFMYNSLMLKVSSLDPWVKRTRMLGLPSLAVQAAEGDYALFLDVPENNIIIQLRSDHMSTGVSVLPEMCAQQFKA